MTENREPIYNSRNWAWEDVEQHRMNPDCWCKPVNVGENAWQHNDEAAK